MTEIINLDAMGRAHTCGKKKEAIARVWVTAGSGKAVIKKYKGTLMDYFHRDSLIKHILLPFTATNTADKFDVECTLKGGGLSSQAHALMHGIAKAIILHDISHRPVLKSLKLLTRDARVVERKKYGRAKARKSFQFSKR